MRECPAPAILNSNRYCALRTPVNTPLRLCRLFPACDSGAERRE